MPKILLFKVEDSFLITGRGLMVIPGPLFSEYTGPVKLGVTLIKPNGMESQAYLHFHLMRVTPTPPADQARYGCILEKLSKEDVPIGTEIWYDESTQRSI